MARRPAAAPRRPCRTGSNAVRPGNPERGAAKDAPGQQTAAPSLLPKVLAEDPLRLPLVRLADVALETHLLRLRLGHRQRLPVADLRLPALHQSGQALDLTGVF